MKPIPHAVLALCLATSLPAMAQNAQRTFLGFTNANGVLDVATSDGHYLIRPYDATIVETSFVPKGESFDPAAALPAVGSTPGRVWRSISGRSALRFLK